MEERRPFPHLTNDRILRTIYGQPTDCTPVFMMQHGGYPLRQTMDPIASARIALEPIRQFKLDATSVPSTMMTIPHALGAAFVWNVNAKHCDTKYLAEHMCVMFVWNKNDIIDYDNKYILKEPAGINQLCTKKSCRESLYCQFRAFKHARVELNGEVPLVGFIGSPWTIMAFMVGGRECDAFTKAKKWLYQHPYDSGILLDIITEKIIDYLCEQVEAGAQLLQVFESHLGYMTPELFRKFQYPNLKKIAEEVKQRTRRHGPVPMIISGLQGDFAIEKIGKNPNLYDVVGIDCNMDPAKARALVHEDITLMGNLDPSALYGELSDIKIRAKKMVEAFGTRRFIAGLGHDGIYHDVKPEAITAFVDAVHEHSLMLNRSENLNQDY